MAQQEVLEMVSRDQELRRLDGLGARAAEAFGLAGARLTLREHKQNTTFRVRRAGEGEDEGFLLRIAMAGRYDTATIRSEMVWLQALADLGAPQPRPAADGSLVVELPLRGETEPRCCVLLGWIPGRSLERSLAPARVAEIGELLARLHRRAEGFVAPPGFARPRWDLDRLLGPSQVLPAERLPAGSEALLSVRDRALLEDAGAAVRRRVAALGDGPEVFGLIHTDLEPDNVVLARDGLRPIDHEHSGWGYYLYDVGASLLALADQRDFPALQRAFLAGYQGVRPLPAEQLALVDTFLVLRCLFSLRLIFLEIWDLPGTREDAVSMVPFMLGGIRRLLGPQEPARPSAGGGTDGDRDAHGLETLSTVQFLSRLRARGILLRAEDEQLRFSAPQGALTPALRSELAARKASVLAFLKQTGAAGGASALPPVRPVGREPGRPLPLSFAQNRLWFIDQMDPGNAAYNIPIAVRIEGELDAAVLERTFNELVRRHEVLRTTFGIGADGEPCQIVAPRLTLTLHSSDLRRLPAAMRQAEVRRATAEETLRPFDLAVGPLVRTTLLRLGEADHLLLFTMHHIISDAWSGGIVVREVAALYEAFARGAPSPLGALPVQYADFAQWQRETLVGEVLEEQIGYWRRQLGGCPELLELPTDRPRPSVQDWQGGRRPLAWPEALRDGLLELSQHRGATLFMTLLAAWSALLARYSGQSDVVVGGPIAGRNRQETEGLIGFFVNTLVLRSDLAGDPSFAELLERTRRVTLDAFKHQDLPFERLVEELQPQRSLSHSPFFQVVMVLQNVPASSARISGLVLRRLPSAQTTTPFDLALSAEEVPGGLRGSLRYRKALFDAATIERMIGHFETLLRQVVATPEERLSRISLLSPGQRQQLLREWNDTAEEPISRRPVAVQVEAHAAERPHAVAVSGGGEALSYGELNRRADRLAHHLVDLGVGPEVPVGVCVRRTPLEEVVLLAIFKAGGAYVPLDPTHPLRRRRFTLEDAGVGILLADVAGTDELAAPGLRILGAGELAERLERPVAARQGAGEPICNCRPEHRAYVIYTSGSTGIPKGVEIEHRALANLVSWHRRRARLSPADRSNRLATLAFDASVWEIWTTLTAGAELRITPAEARTSPRSLLDWLVTEDISVGLITTALALPTLALDWPATAKLRQVFTGGERVPQPPPPGLPFELINDYGPTENTVLASAGPAPPDPAGAPPSIGRPLANVTALILGNDLREVPAGVRGELCIAGASLARGYLGRPALTAEKFVPHPCAAASGERLYRSGDLARCRPDGRIDFLGRIDHQVKLRGFRIELGEIESALEAHAGIGKAVVVVREDAAAAEKRLIAYLVPRSWPPPGVGELRRFLAERLADHMVPALYEFLEELPLTPNGKVDRRALPDPEGSRPTLEVEYAAPRTALEETIAELWREALQIDKVGRHDSFFDLGGHSLLMARVRSQLEERLATKIPMLEMFRSPTVSALAEYVGSGREHLRAAERADDELRGERLKQGMNRLRQRKARAQR